MRAGQGGSPQRRSPRFERSFSPVRSPPRSPSKAKRFISSVDSLDNPPEVDEEPTLRVEDDEAVESQEAKEVEDMELPTEGGKGGGAGDADSNSLDDSLDLSLTRVNFSELRDSRASHNTELGGGHPLPLRPGRVEVSRGQSSVTGSEPTRDHGLWAQTRDATNSRALPPPYLGPESSKGSIATQGGAGAGGEAGAGVMIGEGRQGGAAMGGGEGGGYLRKFKDKDTMSIVSSKSEARGRDGYLHRMQNKATAKPPTLPRRGRAQRRDSPATARKPSREKKPKVRQEVSQAALEAMTKHFTQAKKVKHSADWGRKETEAQRKKRELLERRKEYDKKLRQRSRSRSKESRRRAKEEERGPLLDLPLYQPQRPSLQPTSVRSQPPPTLIQPSSVSSAVSSLPSQGHTPASLPQPRRSPRAGPPIVPLPRATPSVQEPHPPERQPPRPMSQLSMEEWKLEESLKRIDRRLGGLGEQPSGEVWATRVDREAPRPAQAPLASARTEEGGARRRSRSKERVGAGGGRPVEAEGSASGALTARDRRGAGGVGGGGGAEDRGGMIPSTRRRKGRFGRPVAVAVRTGGVNGVRVGGGPGIAEVRREMEDRGGRSGIPVVTGGFIRAPVSGIASGITSATGRRGGSGSGEEGRTGGGGDEESWRVRAGDVRLPQREKSLSTIMEESGRGFGRR